MRNPKSTTNESATEQESRIHPLVWAAVGGGVVALLAWVFAVALSFREPPSVVPQHAPVPDEWGKGDTVVRLDARHTDAASEVVQAVPNTPKPPIEPSIKSMAHAQASNVVEPLSPAPTPLSAEDLYDRVAPSVVTIKVNDNFGQQIYSGSGFFINESLLREEDQWGRSIAGLNALEAAKSAGPPYRYGHLLTNFHVIRPAVSAEVIFSNDDKGTVLNVTAEDENADLALVFVEIPLSESSKGLPLATDDPRVGATVYAIGSPQGLTSSLSQGIVSGFRELSTGGRWLQTTTPISHGSSGGPLLLNDGTIAGVTTLTRENAQNVNFAVPASQVKTFLSSKFQSRGLGEGASILWHEGSDFDVMSLVMVDHSGRYSEVEQHAVELLCNARKAMWKEHHEQAINLAEEADKTLPDKFKYLAAYIMGKSKSRLATEATQGAKSVDESYARYRANDRARAALPYLLKVTKSKPDFSPGFNALADHYKAAGDWPDALLASDSLVKLMPRCADALDLRAECYKALNKPESARSDLLAAIDLEPRTGSLRYDLGEVLVVLGDYGEAIDSYETARELKYPAEGAHWSIGVAYRKAGDFEKAIAAFAQAKVEGFSADSCDYEIAMCKQGER